NMREIVVLGRDSIREMVVKKVIDLKRVIVWEINCQNSGCIEKVIVSEGISCKEVIL
ncbi:15934_t:CDS:2, partial [Gigaspora margarita]